MPASRSAVQGTDQPPLERLQGLEPRVIKAASEVTAKGFAKITLLGDHQAVTAEAKKLGADISGCTIVDPKVCCAVHAKVVAISLV